MNKALDRLVIGLILTGWLVGAALVVQYARYLREIKAETTMPFMVTTAAAPASEMFELEDD